MVNTQQHNVIFLTQTTVYQNVFTVSVRLFFSYGQSMGQRQWLTLTSVKTWQTVNVLGLLFFLNEECSATAHTQNWLPFTPCVPIMSTKLSHRGSTQTAAQVRVRK